MLVDGFSAGSILCVSVWMLGSIEVGFFEVGTVRVSIWMPDVEAVARTDVSVFRVPG
jgi:hypothetical protein